MKDGYILSVDQGTTSSRAILFDHAGRVVAVAQKEFTQIFPQPGWVEHDPREILSTQLGVITEVMVKAGITSSQVVAMGITNQRETTMVWDRETGEPVYNAIVWQCRRTADRMERIAADPRLTEMIRTRTGLIPDAYFSASKIEWILDHVEDARGRAEAGELVFGTVDTWLIWQMTAGESHVTDYTNASRTLLFNIHELDWDDDLLELFHIPRIMLPEVLPSRARFGVTSCEAPIGSVPICGVAGDQQAALFGQCCFKPGEVKNTYGTGGFLLMNTGDSPVSSSHGLLTTMAASADGSPAYALEGSVFISGAVIKWLVEELGILDEPAQSEQLAWEAGDNGGVYVVPAFTGLGAPWWDPYARGAIYGLTRGTSRAQVVRAALESLAFQSFDVIDTMRRDSGVEVSALKVDGGASENDYLLQFQADLLDTPVSRPMITETTALGAAYLAGLEVGYWADEDDLCANWKLGRRFEPGMGPQERNRMLDGWHDAVARTLTTSGVGTGS